ncbi:pre-mRNA-splicing factor cwc2 [Niveomyces insectorum RCEF 264]|uniref:Pre-mRNA-splicing factor CWC2 n=1 Tax=Niveomyces insectorum RCEF 264 TaxID=1081102 RepID=A0A167YMM8_9HYPO|nr:pre-mRNA-splicing factor cwc2 [Niveomyces insectorum RCEF 264]
MVDTESEAAHAATKSSTPVAASGDLAVSTRKDATTATNNQNTRKIIRKKRRPARPQVDPATFKTEPPPQTGVTFNIWYNKWSGGDRESSQASQSPAKGRCNIARDSGYTLADNVSGSYFCLFFARGLCPKGSDCPYLHRLPMITDIFNPNIDCFGRDKFSDYRDDMGGVGSFLRPNRTVYVGRIHVSDDIEEVVARHFAEWGQVERIRVLNTRGVAFITYTNEANAQFAKEAMAHQSLDHDEVLNVRWATVDPNPMAQAREARRVEEQAAAAIRAVLPPEYVAELEGRDPDARKRRRIEGGFGLQGYDAPDSVWYAQARRGKKDGNPTAIEYAASSEEASLSQAADASSGPVDGDSGTGILSSATLAALDKRRGTANGLVFKPKSETKAVGALVDYDSDSSDGS